jgi:hypothetical protein
MRKHFGSQQFFVPAVLVVLFLASATAPSSAQTPYAALVYVC